MGLRPIEVKRLHLKDFYKMQIAYRRKEERKWEHTRVLSAITMNYGGMGTKKFMQPHQLIPLGIDKEYTLHPVSTIEQAMTLLKEFEH